jgi:hypothetical protein
MCTGGKDDGSVNQEFGVRFPGKGKDFYLLHIIQTISAIDPIDPIPTATVHTIYVFLERGLGQ